MLSTKSNIFWNSVYNFTVISSIILEISSIIKFQKQQIGQVIVIKMISRTLL